MHGHAQRTPKSFHPYHHVSACHSRAYRYSSSIAEAAERPSNRKGIHSGLESRSNRVFRSDDVVDNTARVMAVGIRGSFHCILGDGRILSVRRQISDRYCASNCVDGVRMRSDVVHRSGRDRLAWGPLTRSRPS